MIIGPTGQLGADLVRVFREKDGYEVIPVDRSEMDLRGRNSVLGTLDRHQPDIVINTAGQTDVDGCESDASYAMQLNANGAGYVASACSRAGAVCVYISSDYVFDGKKGKPYVETDETRPLNTYGISKLEGERLVRSKADRHLIIRTSGLFGFGQRAKRGQNFVEAMIRLAEGGKRLSIVQDQILSPTYTFDLASKIAELIEGDSNGTYHITNSGECSWYRFAVSVFDAAGLSPEIVPVTSEEYGASAERPRHSVLDNSKLERVGIGKLRHWEEALREYISIRKKYSGPGRLVR